MTDERGKAIVESAEHAERLRVGLTRRADRIKDVLTNDWAEADYPMEQRVNSVVTEAYQLHRWAKALQRWHKEQLLIKE